MGWWEQVKAAFSREARDAQEVARELTEKLDAELTRRERDLAATPEERLDTTLEEIAASDQEFDELTRTVRQPGTDAPTTPPKDDEGDVHGGGARSSAT